MATKSRAYPTLQAVSLILCLFSSCASNSRVDEDSRYLDAVREFADNVLEYGRDTYGPKHTPLFVDGLNIHTHEPVKWISPEGEKWVLSNLASQQNLFRTLDGLSKTTGDPKYRQAAMDAIKYAFDNLRSPNGLLYWGLSSAYDALGDRVRGDNKHALKECYPYYELMWEVDSQATKQFIESFWSAHINDWSNLDMDRIGEVMDAPLEKPWDYEYNGGPIFFKSVEPWGHSFFATGSDLSYAAAILSQLSGEKEPLVWAKRLAHRYVETRYPQIGISSILYNLDEAAGYQFRDDFNKVTVHKGSFFPCRPFHPDDYPQPGIRPWICLFLLGERLGLEGKEFTQWALEELTAWGKVAYRQEDNSWIPMFINGTKLEGYVLKKDGYFGPKGTACKLWPTRPIDFYAYSLAFRLTENQFMWEMARSIAAGLALGDMGVNSKVEPHLQLNTQCSDPYVVLAFLELYQKTSNRSFLQAAQRIGDNILRHRFEKGFFVPSKKHIYARFDTLEPLILLHLDVAVRSKKVLVPKVGPSWSAYSSDYRNRGYSRDIDLIYSLTGCAEPSRTISEAAIEGDVNEVRRIILKGADINGREDSLFRAALHRAAISGSKDAVELLLAEGADVEAGDSSGSSALHYATQNGHKDVAELLISKGADVNARNATGDTPMDIAVRRNHREIVELLVASGAEVNIQVAAYMGDLDKVKGFVENGISVNAKSEIGLTPLHAAVAGSQKDVVEFLIANGADVNGEGGLGYTPLCTAIWNKDKDMAELLIANGADVNAKYKSGYTPLYEALWNEDKDMVRLLVDRGAEVNYTLDNDYPPLAYAIWNEDKDMAELFVAHGAKLEVKDHRGWTALRYATDSGNRELVEFFVSKGADVSGFHGAACVGDLDRVKGFVQKGVDIDAKDEMGWTPLYWAACTAREEVAEYLIGKGARVDVKTNDESTPLHRAVRSGSAKLVESFVSKGADVNAKDNKGKTVLSLAKEKGYTEIVGLLRKHGAKE